MAQPETIFRERTEVEIRQLINLDRPYNGTNGVKRPPRVGDVGRIVHITQHRWDGDLIYIVENEVDGHTVWLADFLPEELAPRP